MKKIVVFGNCQAAFLTNVLRESAEITRDHKIDFYSNYIGHGVFNANPFALEELTDCAAFIYHKVYEPNNAQAVQSFIEALPANCLRVPLPYLKSNIYWPLFDIMPSPLGVSAKRPYGLLPYRSSILDAWLAEGRPDAQIIEDFCALDPAEKVDLEKLRNETVHLWKLLESDLERRIFVAEFMCEHWRDTPLFYIYNHISKPLLLHIANQILPLLAAPRLEPQDIRKSYCGDDTCYPVHPKVAKYYGLGFAAPGGRYKCGGRHYNFKEFIAFYLELARAEAAPDFY